MNTLKTLCTLAATAALLGTAMAQSTGSSSSAGSTGTTGAARSDEEARSGTQGAGGTGEGTRPGRAPTQAELDAPCIGLADRQAEVACKKDAARGTGSTDDSKKGNKGGNVADQAG